jgi:hypothetical protein
MKEILITTARQKTEVYILLASFIMAISLNIFGIIIYHTEWKELYTQWFPLLVLTLVIYFLLLFGRLAFTFIVRIFRKKN